MTFKSFARTATFAAATLIASFGATAQTQVQPLRPGLVITPQDLAPMLRGTQLLPRVTDLRRPCPDLAATISQRDGPGNTIIITYGVRNVGSVDYVSGPNQQLLNVSMGGRHARSFPFQNLRAGQSVQWNETYHPFEFPSTYRATVVYDPDIFIDGNPRNDDCNSANNSASLTTLR
ncbi:MAG: hypothetical protein ACK4LQ_07830 [Pararhodobacter sp.]